MSQDQLEAFIAKVQTDPSLQEQLKAEGADPVAIAKAAGFTFKQQDLHRGASELSDEELEGVSGGTNTLTIPYTPIIITNTLTAAIK